MKGEKYVHEKKGSIDSCHIEFFILPLEQISVFIVLCDEVQC